MKKTIAFLLLAILAFTLISSAFAYDGEITFRDIPWGSTHKETEKLFKKSYGKKAKGYSSVVKGLTDCVVPTRVWVEDGQRQIETKIIMVDVDNGKTSEEFGGYPVEDIFFTFYSTTGQKGKGVLHDLTVRIHAEENDKQEKTDALVKFLSDTYGEADVSDGDTWYWIGTENTYISLHMDPIQPKIDILFGKALGDEQ